MLQKDRVYELIIGDYKTGNGILLDKHEIRFDIKKSSDNKRSSNSASIEIYNLSEDELKLVEGDFVTCKLSVGYKENGAHVVVDGNVVEVSSVKSGVDYITQVTMGESYSPLNHIKLKTMVSPGKTVADAIEACRAQMPGVARGSFTGSNLGAPLTFGYPLNGTPRTNLNKICEAYRLEYQISGGVLNVSDENGLLSKNITLAPVVSSETGLIDVPFHTSSEGKKLPKDSRRRRGVQFTALLNTDYIPGAVVKIESDRITGHYRINTSRFSGDFRGNQWYVECFCSEIVAEDLQ